MNVTPMHYRTQDGRPVFRQGRAFYVGPRYWPVDKVPEALQPINPEEIRPFRTRRLRENLLNARRALDVVEWALSDIDRLTSLPWNPEAERIAQEDLRFLRIPFDLFVSLGIRVIPIETELLVQARERIEAWRGRPTNLPLPLEQR